MSNDASLMPTYLARPSPLLTLEIRHCQVRPSGRRGQWGRVCQGHLETEGCPSHGDPAWQVEGPPHRLHIHTSTHIHTDTHKGVGMA